MNNFFTIIIGLLGGLGLFLYGMKLMGDGLQNAAGDKLKVVFDKITSNPVKGVITGALVTAIIQSSSATTVMVVGFVNAGVMNLYQAAAVIMGANIGTTITAQLITFKFDSLVPIFLAVGAAIVIFSKKRTHCEIGNIILGFGVLFLGLTTMSKSMAPLSQADLFKQLILGLQGKKILGVLLGAGMTAVVQSSSATTGILVAMAGTGALPFNIAVPILFGCNIGTCVTAIISSVGTNKTARKAALFHLFFNVIGTIIFLPFIDVFINIVSTITPGVTGAIVKRQIANTHTLFNIINTIILLPFIKYIIKFIDKLIPGEDDHVEMGTKFIDNRILESPSVGFGQVTNEIDRMAEKAKENFKLSMDAFNNEDYEAVNKVYENEKLINLLENEITKFLVKLSNTELGENKKNYLGAYFHIVNDIERIGDHSENIADLAKEKLDKKLKFSDDAMGELNEMFNITLEALNLSIENFKKYNSEKEEKVNEIEENIDAMEKKLRNSHIVRLNLGKCSPEVGTIFSDTISNFERIGDHSLNIAQYMGQSNLVEM